MKYLLSNPPRFEAESPLGNVRFFYSPAVATWFEKLERDLIDMHSKRTGKTETETVAHLIAERGNVA